MIRCEINRSMAKKIVIILMIVLAGILFFGIYSAVTNISKPYDQNIYCEVFNKYENKILRFRSYKIKTKYGFPRYRNAITEVGIIGLSAIDEKYNREKVLIKYGGAHDLNKIFPVLCKKAIFEGKILIIRTEKNDSILFSDDAGNAVHSIQVEEGLGPYLTDIAGIRINGMYTVTDYWYKNNTLYLKQVSYLSNTMKMFGIDDFDEYMLGTSLKCSKCVPVVSRVISSSDYGKTWILVRYRLNEISLNGISFKLIL